MRGILIGAMRGFCVFLGLFSFLGGITVATIWLSHSYGPGFAIWFLIILICMFFVVIGALSGAGRS